MTIKKLLIANRGEIAVRMIRACRELGIRSVAVYSEADRESMHAGLADEAVCIGPAYARDSYLKMDSILAAAKMTGAQAIHPGYGFLSENAGFAAACAERGIVFVGPPADAIKKLGNKIAAKELAAKADVPCVPGTVGSLDNSASGEALLKEANTIGFPLMVKAAAGGGGKGLRLGREPALPMKELRTAQTEAKAAFNDDTVYIEKFIEHPRHVEIQLACDKHGNAVALPERDCTVQRRHQKLVEESPSPAVTPQIRAQMMEAAVRLAKAANYSNVGTVEFLLDTDGRFYFIEVNTRLQVEHPVTETVTGLDLVREQILLAQGEKLSFDQARASRISCHAIEHRVNAEDPSRGFAPCPGTIERLRLPGGPGVRVDTHLYAGYTVPSYYDSLLAKLIVWAPDRLMAADRAIRALSEFSVEGISTTIPFHLRVLADERFRSGKFDTSLADQMLAAVAHQNGAAAAGVK